MDHLNIKVKDKVRISNKKLTSDTKANDQSLKSDAVNKKNSKNLDAHLEMVRKIVEKNNKLQKKKKNSKSTTKLVLSSLLCLSLFFTIHTYYDDIMNFAESIEFSMQTTADARPGAGANARPNTERQRENISGVDRQNSSSLPLYIGGQVSEQRSQKRTWTEEEINIFRGLDERKKQLDEREKHLDDLAKELQNQKVELEKKIARLSEIRDNISKTLAGRVAKDEERLNKLVEVYSNMRPQNAAEVFSAIDENLAVDILSRMKRDNAANILNLIEPEKAKKLSEKFVGYKRQ